MDSQHTWGSGVNNSSVPAFVFSPPIPERCLPLVSSRSRSAFLRREQDVSAFAQNVGFRVADHTRRPWILARHQSVRIHRKYGEICCALENEA